jgi:L-alanine-DL-glutamate epimerase-like enolase superfamily enzyme
LRVGHGPQERRIDTLVVTGAALQVSVEQFPLKQPFQIAGHTFTTSDVVVVALEKNGHIGRGEASGVFYRDDDVPGMVGRLEEVRSSIERSIDRESLGKLLPIGGARNAVDCALWDLEARLTGKPAWEIAGLRRPGPLSTTFTVGANTPETMAADARAYTHARILKLKLTGQAVDADRLRAVRRARPNVALMVDANQSYTRDSLDALMPLLTQLDVRLIEQPFSIGQERSLDGFRSTIPIAADESAQGIADLSGLIGRFQVVNIKLDKCGGLTEGLEMARSAARLGLKVMVGNMVGSSLAMAPAALLGQLCHVVDLDGPVFLRTDRSPPVEYRDGMISVPDALWGAPAAVSGTV